MVVVVMLSVLCLFRPTSSSAWGPAGHEIVARIAELNLSPSAHARIADLLPRSKMYGRPDHIWYSRVCNWPDFIRHDRPETASWHFVDIPFKADRYDPVRDCREHGGCVVEKIEYFRTVLADPRGSQSNRVEALKFLVHFVGDVHQPLHCATRNGDQGGNLCIVLFPDRPKPVSLHTVWDFLLIQRTLDEQKVDSIEYAARLNGQITASDAQLWRQGRPEDWAMESHQLAVKDAYANIPTEGPPEKLTEGYIQQNQTVVDQQLKKAGIRLAALLSRALGEQVR